MVVVGVCDGCDGGGGIRESSLTFPDQSLVPCGLLDDFIMGSVFLHTISKYKYSCY